MEPKETQLIYPSKQLHTLKEFYGLTIREILARSKVAAPTFYKVLQGDPSVDFRKFVAIANAFNADVVITLRSRDPEFIEHIKAMVPD